MRYAKALRSRKVFMLSSDMSCLTYIFKDGR